MLLYIQIRKGGANLTRKKLTIKQLRVLQDMSREELAQKTNLHYNTILNYENNIDALRKASYETIESLADALSVTVDDIFLGTNSVKLS